MQLILTISIARNIDYLKTHTLLFIVNETCECPKSHFNKHTWRSKCLFQIHVHGNDWTSLYEQVPKECLPTEYGGNAGSVAEHWGESKHHYKIKIVQFYSTLISMDIANAPQKLLFSSSGKWYKNYVTDLNYVL